MDSNFDNMGISEPILKAITEMGFESPTEVQFQAIPRILKREDLIIMSKTGSGKTAVFGVSTLQLTDANAHGPQCLILTPTRELAVQVDSDLKAIGKYLPHKTTAVYGQHSMHVEIQALQKGVSIITGTPGRVYDHIQSGHIVTKHIKFLVLDEADRMLDMGFFDQVVRIIKTLPRDRVTLLFSATIPNEIQKICRDYMKHPVTIEIASETKTVDTIELIYYRVEKREKQLQLDRLLQIQRPASCIIFCNTRVAVDQLIVFLSKKGYTCQALHGDVPQTKRLKTIQQFKQGIFHILVATDIAARGIHVDDLSLVVNYDVPEDKDSYVHRIGRTGRAGNVGNAITLVTTDDIMNLYEIEEHIGAMIIEADLPSEVDVAAVSGEVEIWKHTKAPNVVEIAPKHKAHNSEPYKQKPPYQGQNQGPRQNTNPNAQSVPRPKPTTPNQPVQQSPPQTPLPKPQQQAQSQPVQQPPQSQQPKPPQPKPQPPTPPPVEKTAPQPKIEKVVEPTLPVQSPPSTPSTTESKPMIKRIINHLLGK